MKVSPDGALDLSTECAIDIANFLPTRKHWLAFVKCLAGDNEADLRTFAKRINWTAFLSSRDIQGKWLNCSPGFIKGRTIGHNTMQSCVMHQFPTNPFFVAMFYNARKCLQLMHDSGVDFSCLTEHGMTAYHLLMSAMHFMSATTNNSLETSEDLKCFLIMFHQTLFTRQQQSRMLARVCNRGMTPLSWGVYLGLANHVEFILYYYSPNCALHTEAIGMSEHISMDVSDHVGENPCFFTSPICILLDLYGEGTLPQLKELGICRNGFIWRLWIEALYNRNKVFVWMYLVFATLLTCLSVAFFGTSVNDYLCSRCSGGPYTYPVGLVVVLSSWIVLLLTGTGFIVIGILRKEYYRRKVGYPKSPRQNYKDLKGWLLPGATAMPVAAFLLWLVVSAEQSCHLFGPLIYNITGCCTILFLIANLFSLACYLRLYAPLTTLMSSFYNSLGAFTVFIMFYLALIAVFARMFQSSFAFNSVEASNNGTSFSRPDTLSEFFKGFYLTFLVSLNIVDSTKFVPAGNRIDLSITHLFFILLVPVLFINFVIGILSSVVNRVIEHDVENRFILMLSAAEFSERTFFCIRMVTNKIFGRQTIKLSVCQALGSQSKLLAFSEDTLDSVTAVDKQIIASELQRTTAGPD